MFGWYPASGLSQIGFGTTRELMPGGEGRFAQLEAEARELFTDLEAHSHGASAPPRLVGGLAFAAGLDGGRLWQGFGDGCFVLPRWCYGYHRTDAYLSLAVRPETDDPEVALGELDAIWDVLEQPLGGPHAASLTVRGIRIEHSDPQLWRQHVEKIRDLIATGEFRKIVAARCTDVTSQEPFDVVEMTRRLGWMYPECTRFFFRRGSATLVGASPETLFTQRGTELSTHAVAGTVRVDPRRGFDVAGEELLGADKDREEHAVVVREISASLEPLTEALEVAEVPRLMKLRDLLHLETPIRARLRPAVHAARILEALHPTPAMGGWPRVAAARWIAEHESPSRGWYSGPLGWLDAAGDAQFGVAIRCALILGHRAHAFAGAGIMGESDPDKEYDETADKLQAMLRVLGVEARTSRSPNSREPN